MRDGSAASTLKLGFQEKGGRGGKRKRMEAEEMSRREG